MSQLTKAQLAAELATERHNAELLATERERLMAELAAVKEQLAALSVKTPVMPVHAQTSVRVSNLRKIFEFDPAVPGDFKRASELARQSNGAVRRVN